MTSINYEFEYAGISNGTSHFQGGMMLSRESAPGGEKSTCPRLTWNNHRGILQTLTSHRVIMPNR